ncbi:MAG: T9SS type A sorting domain-containing protein, partial [Flavobacteriales bacterium]|nr:T9SS type A sorting domain-containing protein [Flavobacteriales bacterium]
YASNVTQRGADHTNFKISAGETVTLSAPNGTVLSSVAVPSWLVPNASYGSSPNGSNDTWGMFSSSTPGAENPSGVADLEEDTRNLFKIYPNPTDEGMISFTAVGDYTVYDVQGRMLGIYYNVKKLNIEDLQSGVYLVVNEFGRSERLVKL